MVVLGHPTVRGFVWAVYETDDGRLFALRVDAESPARGDRGWLTVGVQELVPFPRGWLPRRVYGVDEAGNIRFARIGRLDAPLWVGTATQFVVEANDGTRPLATVLGRQQERIPPV